MQLQQRDIATIAAGPRTRLALPQNFRVKARSKGDVEGLWILFGQEQYRRFAALTEPFDSPAEVQAWLDRFGSGNLEVVGILDETVVAFAGLYPLGGRQRHTAWITLAVHEAFHGRGIGTILLKLILDSADILASLTRIQLNVFVDNTHAIALYRSFGFRIEGQHERFACRDGVYVDAFTMARIKPEPPVRRTNAEIVSLLQQVRLPSQHQSEIKICAE